MKKTKVVIAIIILILISIFFTGCDNTKKEKEELKGKVIAEINYVNTKIIDLLNTLNNLSFENYTILSEEVKLDNNTEKQQSKQGNDSQGGNQGGNQEGNQQQNNASKSQINTTQMTNNSILLKDRNNIDWSLIKPQIELLDESWSVILLDLYSLDVNNDSILGFSSKINECIINIKNEDKASSLVSLSELYSIIPIFLKEINADENLQKTRETQSYIINAYSLAEDMNNEEINNNIVKAIDVYSGVMNNVDYSKDRTYKINKIYVLLNELLNCLDEKDNDVFYVKYKNVMEYLEIM